MDLSLVAQEYGEAAVLMMNREPELVAITSHRGGHVPHRKGRDGLAEMHVGSLPDGATADYNACFGRGGNRSHTKDLSAG